MIKVANKEERARARLRAALRCVRTLRRATTATRPIVTTVDKYDGYYIGPNSDFHERCVGCGMYAANHAATHEPGCLVVEAHRALNAFDKASKR